MKAVSGELPTDESGWSFEVKWDGMRVLAYVDPAHPEPGLRLVTTNGKDASGSFPELWPMAQALGSAAVLDGEVVAFADGEPSGGVGRPDFGRLQQRMHVTSVTEARRRATTVPVSLVVFDLLHLGGHPLLDVAYHERTRLLRKLVPAGPSWSVPTPWPGSGVDLLQLVTDHGLEGVMAKRTDSPYQPGRRSPAWRKVKVRRQQELVVGGWTEGSGNRAGELGALLLGVVEEGSVPEPTSGLRLTYAGKVGTGFDTAERDRLLRQLHGLEVGGCPFSDRSVVPRRDPVHFVRPELVVEVAFGEWTGDGVLRHPAYLGQRIDKDAAEVRREP